MPLCDICKRIIHTLRNFIQKTEEKEPREGKFVIKINIKEIDKKGKRKELQIKRKYPKLALDY